MTNVAWTTLTEEVRMESHGATLGVTKGVKLKLIASLHLVLCFSSVEFEAFIRQNVEDKIKLRVV